MPPIWESWKDRLGRYPYCTDNVSEGLSRKPRLVAATHRYIEHSPSRLISYLTIDCDYPVSPDDLCHDAGLPEAGWITTNPKNGHAHVVWPLATPIGFAPGCREAPILAAADAERGLRRRLKGDPAYAGLTTKTPGHPDHRTRWLAPHPRNLGEFFDVLTRDEMRKPARAEREAGIGRNCTIFDRLRKFAYAHAAKHQGGSSKAWRQFLLIEAASMNHEFCDPLGPAELRGIAKSVAEWTWRRSFDASHSFQAARGRRSGAKRTGKMLSRLDAVRSLDLAGAAVVQGGGAEPVYPETGSLPTCLTPGVFA